MKRKEITNISYGIVGLGRFGTELAIRLAEAGKDILVMDADEEKVKVLRDYTENAYIVKTLDKKSLSETGIQNCDVAIVCIGEHLDTSILTVLHLVSFKVPRVIAKASSKDQGEVLEKLGAEVVYPERDMAIRLARRLDSSPIINYIELSEKIDITRLKVSEKLVGNTIQNVNVRREYGLNIIAIEHNGVIITDVDPFYIFQPNDTIFVIGDRERIQKFELEQI